MTAPASPSFEIPADKLSAIVEQLKRKQAGALAPQLRAVDRNSALPLSFSQQRLWFLHQMDPGSPAYNIPLAVELVGRLNVRALGASLGEVVRRHEVLRTTFTAVAGRPVQRIGAPAAPDLPVLDLRALPDPLGELHRISQVEVRRPFDLASGPLLRAMLLRLGSDRHVLLVTLHHIVSDAWSSGILAHELTVLYGAFADGRRSPLPELGLQYADFAAWQRQCLAGEAFASELRLWVEKLAGAPSFLLLPVDRPRPAIPSAAGRREAMLVPEELAAALSRRAFEQGATPFMLLLAAFKTLLFRYTGQEDLLVGTPSAGRNRVEIERLIGFFVNTLVLRTAVAGSLPFTELLRRVRAGALFASDHQNVPFEVVVEELRPERETSRTPLFQVMFALQNAPPPVLSLPSLDLSLLTLDSVTAKFDLTFDLTETPSRLVGSIEYSTDLFDRSTVERMARNFETLLAGIAARPEALLQDLPLLSPAELAQALGVCRQQAAGPLPSLPRLFAEQVRRDPHAIAVCCESEELSYAELNRRANRLAHRLRGIGVGADRFVGLLCERSLDLVIAVLGILKAGGAYVPLDPSAPAERRAGMLADAGAAVLVVQRELALDVPTDGEVIVLEEALQPGGPETDPEAEIPAEAAAYVIFTSGSTGRPKGVVVSHANVVRLFTSTRTWFGFTADDVWSLFHSYAFDFSVWEIWGALLYGGRLVVVPYEVSRSPERFYEALERESVTVLSQTPSAFRQLMRVEEERGAAGLPALRWVVFGGEALEVQGLRRWFELHGEERPRLVNMYGITETTVHVTYRPLLAADALSPAAGSVIGEVIPDLGVHVRDAAGGLVPAGVYGEAHVGGAGVARGYLGRPELTAERFVPDPFSAVPGARLYRSGDLARWRHGELEYQGRIDSQVKIRGFRIELGEIESVLAGHPGVAEAVVVVRQDGGQEKRLVAYVVPAQPAFPGAAGLRLHLREKLPDYMVPGVIVVLDRLPLTVNGKVDRRSLPVPDLGARAFAAETAAPESPVEEILAEIWGQVLGVERVGPGDDFFALGGHSLLATQMISRIRDLFRVELPLRAAFEAPVVRELAARVTTALQDGAMAPAPPIVPVPRDGSLPLSFAQQRLWFLDQLAPGNIAFNLAGGIRLEGALDLRTFATAVDGVVRRHEILRTVFPAPDGEPVQSVAPPAPVPLPLIDLSALPGAARREQLQAIGEGVARIPFDLARGPLLRLFLIVEGGARHTLLFVLHHIVTDGWSMSVLVREIAALYSGALGGGVAPLPDLPVQYGDYAAWQRRWLAGETLAAQLDYWRRQLAGAPPVLVLPTDRPRPEEQSFAGSSLRLSLLAGSLPALRRLALDTGASLFMLLFAAFHVLLRSLSGEEDIVVGTDVANRNRSETEGLIGFFINQLPLRVSSAGNPTFRELIGRVREVALGAYAHQDLPFEKMVDALKLDRQLRYSPVFQVKLFLLNLPAAALDLPGLQVDPLELERGTANLDLNVALRESGDALTGWANFRTDLFEAATVSRLLKSFEALLARVLVEPDLSVDELCRFSAQNERTQLAMEDRSRQESKLQRLKQIRPKAVHVPQADPVRMETLRPDSDILLVVQPTVDGLDLADWARGRRDLIEEKLQRHGAILFRGFAVGEPDDFERFARQICPVLYRENGEHVRQNVGGSLYTPTFYPADQQLLWHNENSFNHRWPMKIMFCCMKAPERGGETPIVDSRQVYERIDHEIRQRFEDKQVLYMRNYGRGLGLDWQTVFQTADRSAVEERARQEHLDLEWKADDNLCTRAVRPAVIRHPRTGSPSWFNQAQHWHVSCLDPDTRRSMEEVFAEEDLPRNCYFGDGSAIPDESMSRILEIYRELEVSVPWQKGDVILVDNILAAHGRNPFAGERKILVAMGDMVAFDEI